MTSLSMYHIVLFTIVVPGFILATGNYKWKREVMGVVFRKYIDNFNKKDSGGND